MNNIGIKLVKPEEVAKKYKKNFGKSKSGSTSKSDSVRYAKLEIDDEVEEGGNE